MADSVATNRIQHLLKAVAGTSVSDARPSKPVKRVLVTGAAGQIGYALLPRIANGEMFGADQPVILHLLEIEPSMKALNGVVMELMDMAAPLLQDVVATSDAAVAFKDIDYAILVGAFPRRAGMERKDLLTKNSSIFSHQGRMLDAHASKDVKVLVVGNPANTMCAVASSHAPSIPKKNFTALTRLDHARAIAQIAEKLAVPMKTITNVVIWGNHSSTQVPDLTHALLQDFPSKGFTQSVACVIDDPEWVEKTFIPTVQTRGGAIIKARGLSSALSAANAIVRCMRSWVLGTRPGDWVSMAVVSDGTHYGIPEGLVYSFPCQCNNGEWTVVDGLHISKALRARMDISAEELAQEKAAIKELFGPNC